MRNLALVVLLVGSATYASGVGTRPAAPAKVDKATINVDRWLVLGPAPLAAPLFHDEKRGAYGPAEMVAQSILPPRDERIANGSPVPWPAGGAMVWREVEAGREGLVELLPGGKKSTTPTVALLAVTLRAHRFQEIDAELPGSGLRRLLVDGEQVLASAPVPAGGKPAEAKGKVKLTPGTHLAIVQALCDTAGEARWNVGLRLAAPPEAVTFSLPPERDLDIADVLDRPHVTSVAVSADGELTALSLRRVWAGSDDGESWVEVRATADGEVRRTFRGGTEVSDVAFVPAGHVLSYLAKEKPKGKDVDLVTLWLADLDSGQVTPLLERIEEMTGYLWSPAGDLVVYATSVKAEKDKRGVKVLEGLLDRQKGYRDKEVLWMARVPGGARLRLTAGSLSASAASFSPDGRRLLVRRQVEDFTARPFSREELWEIELATLAGRKLRDFGWLDDVSYAPDGERIVVVSGPSAFGDIGRSLPTGMTPNEGDGQLYLWDPQSGKAEALSRDFDPAISDAAWCRHDGSLIVRAEVGDRRRLFRWEPATRTFRELDLGGDVVGEWAVAERAPVVVAAGSGPWRPDALWALGEGEAAGRLIVDPALAWYPEVRRGAVQEWSCTTAKGQVIPGRVYLPVGFDPARSYPAIVYYYAGTSPVSRDFGGRYPKEWWAALGYVVYVLQPSGCTGYGQAHSALHVNEWGAVVVDEIIEATKAFLGAHPYVDAKRVGCIGASYGGFTTMLLLTKTDMFAAAVSHAGISSISSYWGEGYWGYTYNALSAADSFPWNNRELYVERSALFSADKVKTPLLLTHGTGDTNVPVGESDSFYTALKLVGAPVEYLQVEGEDHWILDHAKRVVWSRAIVAWFDRFLKGQPEWWEELAARQEKGKDGGTAR